MENILQKRLVDILANPESSTFFVARPENAMLTPLVAADEDALIAFYEALSPRTRGFYSVIDSQSLAHAHCTTIAQYDKLRLVLRIRGESTIIAIVEFSFDLTRSDIDRFASHGHRLDPAFTCRWGLCVADEWHRCGVGTALAVPSFKIASRFDRTHIILLGGVLVANAGAEAYYRSIGLVEAGRFRNDAGVEAIDMLYKVQRTAGQRNCT